MKKIAKVLMGVMVLTALIGVVGCSSSSSDATTDTEVTTTANA